MKLLVTRPMADAEPLAQRLAADGHAVVIDPLLTIRFEETTPDLSDIAALLFTSANGVRAFVGASSRRDLKAYAVGDRTATLARAAGFPAVESADGDVAALAARVIERQRPEAGPLLHISGSEVAGDLSGRLTEAGFTVRRQVLYRAEPASDLNPATDRALADGTLNGIILFSPRTARHLVLLLLRAPSRAAATSRLVAWCLSPAVAEVAAALDWAAVKIAPVPTQAALLALIPTVSRRPS